jgi:hypothetical protein
MKDFCKYLQTGFLAVLLVVVVGFGTVHAFEAKLSGQVNQMMMWADDGNEDDFFVADNTNSSTRFRFTGSQPFGKIKAGFQIELEAQRNRSNELFIGQTTMAASTGTTAGSTPTSTPPSANLKSARATAPPRPYRKSIFPAPRSSPTPALPTRPADSCSKTPTARISAPQSVKPGIISVD